MVIRWRIFPASSRLSTRPALYTGSGHSRPEVSSVSSNVMVSLIAFLSMVWGCVERSQIRGRPSVAEVVAEEDWRT